MTHRHFAVLLLVVLAPFATAYAQQDVKGSKDHPLITRMPGFYISSYKVDDFAAFDPTVVGGKEAHWEGKKISYGYSHIEGAKPVSMLQIVRNYEAAIRQAGGTILGGDERRTAATILKSGATTGVYVEAFNEGTSYELTIVESQPMQQEVVADANAMGRDLTTTGKTIVRGIYFDTASATIKQESAPALAEIVKLLQKNPALNAYVVGHTDNVGGLEKNLKLSSDRADAVMKAIVARGIAPRRLKAAGVGPYSPLASNHSDAGRAENRRVELIEQ